MPTDLITQFFDRFAGSINATLGQLTGSRGKYVVSPKQLDDGDLNSQELWVGAALGGEPPLALAFGLSRATGLFLARALLSETPAEDAAFNPEDQELLVEFWKQALGRASHDLRDLLQDSAFEYLNAESPAWQPAMTAELKFEVEARTLTISIQLGMELVRRLAQAEPEIAVSVSSSLRDSPVSPNNLDLLLDTPLAVTLRFGQRRMPLREIMQLASGSVIELDRQAEDAVDLLLDERLIARGQVVVVDGCYGLRVSEVCR